jgi:hypothetical protein
MSELRFEVYGRRIAVQSTETGRKCFLLGEEGKRRAAPDIVVPDFVLDDELLQYLADLLHECATPANGTPKRLY